MHRLLAAVVLVTTLCACSDNGLFRRSMADGDVDLIGMQAEHRVVVTSSVGPLSRPGMVDPRTITCTEPSPDVGKAVSRAFEAALAVPDKGSASLSSSATTSLAQLAERTVSVQLFREKMYQYCLAYRNGAISGVTYTLIMSRLDDAIVTLMMGETAGGAFGRSGAAITTSTSGKNNVSMPTLTAGLDGIDAAAAKVEQSRTAIADLTRKRDELQTKCNEKLAAQADEPAKNRPSAWISKSAPAPTRPPQRSTPRRDSSRPPWIC